MTLIDPMFRAGRSLKRAVLGIALLATPAAVHAMTPLSSYDQIDRDQVVVYLDQGLSALGGVGSLTDAQVKSQLESDLIELCESGFSQMVLSHVVANNVVALFGTYGDGSLAGAGAAYTNVKQEIEPDCQQPIQPDPADEVDEDPVDKTPDVIPLIPPHCIQWDGQGNCLCWRLYSLPSGWADYVDDPNTGLTTFSTSANGAVSWTYCQGGISDPAVDLPGTSPVDDLPGYVFLLRPSETDDISRYMGGVDSIDDIMDRKDAPSQANAELGRNGTNETTCNPVMLGEGTKLDVDVDISVRLPGMDFSLYRTYSGGGLSQNGEFPWAMGRGWGTSLDGWVKQDFNQANYEDWHRRPPRRVSVTAFPVEYSTVFYEFDEPNAPGEYLPVGPGKSRILQLSRTIGGVTTPVWVLDTPGAGEMIYFRTAGSEAQYKDTPMSLGDLNGRILERRDVAGNRWEYTYTVFSTPSGLSRPRVSEINFFASQESTAIARLEATWDTTSLGSRGTGNLKQVEIKRPIDGQWLTTQYATYYYANSPELGLTNSQINQLRDSDAGPEEDYLVLVETGKAVNAPLAGETGVSWTPQYAVQFSHYRYLNDEGRITHYVMPQQMEFLANAWGGTATHSVSGHLNSTATKQRAFAFELVKLSASDTLGIDGSAVEFDDLCSKLVSYYGKDDDAEGYRSIGGMVREQKIRSGCGCGTGSTVIERYDYARERMLEPAPADDEFTIPPFPDISLYRWKSSTVRREYEKDDNNTEILTRIYVNHSEDQNLHVGTFAAYEAFDENDNINSNAIITKAFRTNLMVANEIHEPVADGQGGYEIARSWYSLHEFENLSRVREFHASAIVDFDYLDGVDSTNRDYYLTTPYADQTGTKKNILLDYKSVRSLPAADQDDPLELAKTVPSYSVNFRAGGLVTWTDYDTTGLPGPWTQFRKTSFARSKRQGVAQATSGGKLTNKRLKTEIDYVYNTEGAGSIGSRPRVDLVESSKLYLEPTDDGVGAAYEITEFEYGLAPSGLDPSVGVRPRVAWMRTKVKRESSSQNGPGNGLTVSTWDLFNDRGQSVASVDALGTVAISEYDDLTGEAVAVRRNLPRSELASLPDFDAGDFSLGGSLEDIPANTYPTAAGAQRESTWLHDITGLTRVSADESGLVMNNAYRTHVDGDGMLRLQQLAIPHPVGWTDGSSLSATVYTGPIAVQTATPTMDHLESLTSEAPALSFNADGSISTAQSSLPWSPVATAVRSRSTSQYDTFGRLTSSRSWHRLGSNVLLDTIPADYYETAYGYDSRGRVAETVEATGQITRTTYDLNDRAIAVYGGTDANNLRLLAETFYDYDFSGGLTTPVQGVGDGNVTLTRSYTSVDGTAYRDSRTIYDWRNRPRLSLNLNGGIAASDKGELSVAVFDEMDRPIETATFTGYGTSLTNLITALENDTLGSNLSASLPSAGIALTTLTSRAQSFYSDRGLLYRAKEAIDPTDASTGWLQSDTYFDDLGRAITAIPTTGPSSVTTFDGLGRVTEVIVTDGAAGRSCSPSYSSVTAGYGSTTDVVFERMITHYSTINDHSSPVAVETFRRAHDASGSGLGANPIRLVSKTVYDAAYRPIAALSYGAGTGASNDLGVYGTGGATSTTEVTSVPTLDTDDHSVLMTQTSYDTVGRAHETTDALGRVNRTLFDGLDRTYAIIENFGEDAPLNLGWDATDGLWRVLAWPHDVSAPENADRNRITTMVYDAAGALVRQVAHLPKTNTTDDVQVTENIYSRPIGGTTAASGHTPTLQYGLLYEIRYPSDADGMPSALDKDRVVFDYNLAGEQVATKDQNGTVRTFARDVWGRVEHEEVASFGTSPDWTVDQQIKRISNTYDDFGRLLTLSSYTDTAANGGTLANQIEYVYDELGRMIEIYQNPVGDADPLSDDPVVYTYSTDIDTAANNRRRLESISYPASTTGGPLTTVQMQYGTASSVDDRITRMTGITWDAGDRSVAHQYLGTNRRVISTLQSTTSQRLVRNRFINPNDGTTSSGSYPGLDRFGRVTRHVWYLDEDAGSGAQYGPFDPQDRPALIDTAFDYNNVSNILSKSDQRPGIEATHINNEGYKHDDLNRVVRSVRGDIDPETTSPKLFSQEWQLDILGNKLGTKTAKSTGGLTGAPNEARTFTPTNEIIAATHTDGGSTDNRPFVYDHNGNLIKRATGENTNGEPTRRVYTYDAWNRLVSVRDEHEPSGSPGTWTTNSLGRMYYFGAHQRALRLADTDGDDDPDEETRFFYDASWNLLEERGSDAANYTGWPSSPATIAATTFTRLSLRQYIWDPTAQDELIAQRIGFNGKGDPIEKVSHLWSLTGSGHNIEMVIPETPSTGVTGNGTGTFNLTARKSVVYSAYGIPQVIDSSDIDADGSVDLQDQGIVLGGFGDSVGDANYHAGADADANGTIDLQDLNAVLNFTTTQRGQLSALANTIGFGGAPYDQLFELSHMRNRWYSPWLGRWITRDPAGYVDGMSQYLYVKGNPLVYFDPFGLMAAPPYHVQKNMRGHPVGAPSERDFVRMRGGMAQHMDSADTFDTYGYMDSTDGTVNDWVDSVSEGISHEVSVASEHISDRAGNMAAGGATGLGLGMALGSFTGPGALLTGAAGLAWGLVDGLLAADDESPLETAGSTATGGALGFGGGLALKGAGKLAQKTVKAAKGKVEDLRRAARSQAGGSADDAALFHYTDQRGADAMTSGSPNATIGPIDPQGKPTQIFFTNDGAMTGTQAQRNLALPHSQPPTHVAETTVGAVRNAGFDVPPFTRVQENFGQPGGGWETIVNGPIPISRLGKDFKCSPIHPHDR